MKKIKEKKINFKKYEKKLKNLNKIKPKKLFIPLKAGGLVLDEMSEKYMSIGAPMTELPVAQSRAHTSLSHRYIPRVTGTLP